ncbi:MAG TPA: DUF5668 domain-containing protein [Thermoanaerobaculia bacterium]|jgi:hypothetical protein|nr:DUF5668 domain-containing protein [Thermoanaerobaculia bacterium]
MNPLCGRGRERGQPGDPRAAFRHALPRLLFGGALVAVGLLFTLDNLGMVDAGHWMRLWPGLLLLFGIGCILTASRGSEVFYGSLWSLAGGIMLLDNLHLVSISIFDLWPLLLVGVGASLVVRSMRTRVAVPVSASGDDGSVVNAFSVMSGVVRQSSSVAFQGGSLTAFMGGIEVDLRGARMVQQQAVLDCFACWGGIEITVPPGWTVHGNVFPFLGGFVNTTTPPAPEDATGDLVVTGWAVMGGVSVKNG